MERISVVGLGKLGSPMAASFAYKGFKTIGIDLDESKVNAINEGRAPVFEPGLVELLSAGRHNLTATTDFSKAISDTDATFVIVPTPSVEAGGFSNEFVIKSAQSIGEALRTKQMYHLVVLTSTVLPGVTEREILPVLENASGRRCGIGFGLCYSPEFIALGTVIRDFLNPDFLLIGESDGKAGEELSKIYKRVCGNDPPIARMNYINAELAKISLNSFITTKITFANTLARICEQLPGTDVDTIANALGLDTRIGRKYLTGAIGYGGPCFPRDNDAFCSVARAANVWAGLAETTDFLNRQSVEYMTALVKANSTKAQGIGVLGLSYKPGTDVVEESQGLALAVALCEAGYRVTAYDPAAKVPGNRNVTFHFAKSARECVKQSDVVVITTPWPEFRELTSRDFECLGTRRIVIDCWRMFADRQSSDAVEYIALGRQTSRGTHACEVIMEEVNARA